ncbi:MAG TPA: hypothetical protein VI636_11855 [Candidatus Angelobacter sp.]
MPDVLKFKETVDVVATTFSVVVGFALTCFLEKSPMVQRYNQEHPDKSDKVVRGIFLFSSAMILISLALRFLIGSKIHLLLTYGSGHGNVFPFLKDLAFLIFFGVFLVKISWAKDSFQFMRGLTGFLVLVLLWGLITLIFWGDRHFALPWVIMDSIQLAITCGGLVLLTLVRRVLVRHPSILPYTMLLLATLYAVIFGWDLKWIIEKA